MTGGLKSLLAMLPKPAEKTRCAECNGSLEHMNRGAITCSRKCRSLRHHRNR